MTISAQQGLWFVVPAVGELVGCYAFWAWARLGRPAWWLAAGLGCLAVFAWALTRIEAGFAGRAFAAYGGVYVSGALLWLIVVDGARPTAWDLAGVALCLGGTLVILAGSA